MTGIYIHWPYCISKCPYCDFYSKVDPSINQDGIINSYLKDIDFYKQFIKEEVETVFFGGGTPSLISPHNIEKIINHITKQFSCKNLEISLEANPNTNHKNMFADIKNAGVNRLSLGIQSLNEENLKFLGRTHNKNQALQAIDEVLTTFDNHSMDIMLGAPNKEDVPYINNLGFKHISIYQLTIEEGTDFYKRGIKEINEDKALELYKKTQESLSNYKKYEVSNFCKDGFECKHNMGYWQGKDYMGIGKGAHGRLGLMATTHHRQIETLNKEERAQELLIMGLRIVEGIDKSRFLKQCTISLQDFVNQDKLKELKAQGLLFEDDKTLKATSQGFFVLNHIIYELVD